MQELKFNYNVPILESATVDGEFIINGIAINSTVTSNNHKFLPEVLRESADSLINVPLLTDHENMVENIKGRVLASYFDEIDENIKFKAVVKDTRIKEMIKDKLLNSVSVGAAVDPDDIEEIDGIIIPKNITFKELSLVAIPADDGATFGIALKEAYQGWKDSHSNPKGNVRGLTKMSDKTKEAKSTKIVEEESEPEKEAEPEKEPEAEPKEVSTEDAEVEEKLKKVELALKKKRLAMLEKKLKEADVDEEAEKSKEEAKKAKDEEEEEETDDVEESSYYKIVSESRSFSMVKNKY